MSCLTREQLNEWLSERLLCLTPSVRSKVIIALYTFTFIFLLSSAIIGIMFVSYEIGRKIFTIGINSPDSLCTSTRPTLSCIVGAVGLGITCLLLIVCSIAAMYYLLLLVCKLFDCLGNYAKELESSMDKDFDVQLD